MLQLNLNVINIISRVLFILTLVYLSLPWRSNFVLRWWIQKDARQTKRKALPKGNSYNQSIPQVSGAHQIHISVLSLIFTFRFLEKMWKKKTLKKVFKCSILSAIWLQPWAPDSRLSWIWQLEQKYGSFWQHCELYTQPPSRGPDTTAIVGTRESPCAKKTKNKPQTNMVVISGKL